MENKFNIGDYVEVVAVDGDSLPIGSRGIIIGIDEEFGAYPYILDVDDDLYYNDNMLRIVKSKAVEPKIDCEPTELIRFRITYYIDKNRTTLTKDGVIIVDDDKKDFHVQNVFLSGFFEGLTYAGVRFEATAEYIRG